MPNLKSLKLEYCTLPTFLQVHAGLGRMERLENLQISFCELEEEARWAKRPTSPLHLPALRVLRIGAIDGMAEADIVPQLQPPELQVLHFVRRRTCELESMHAIFQQPKYNRILQAVQSKHWVLKELVLDGVDECDD